MAEYIKRDAFIAWLKRIPLKDLSDGLGLCRIIMEEDFKRAIRELPREMIVDVAPVVRCKDCTHATLYEDSERLYCTNFCGLFTSVMDDDYCSYGERKEGADNG